MAATTAAMRLNPADGFDATKREDALHPSQRRLIFKLMIEKSEPKEWAGWLRSPLEQACEAGDSELVDTLLAAGADAAGLGRRGRTLLHAAAAGGNGSVVWSLLDHGAKPNIEARLSEDEWLVPDTPLQVAARNGHAAAARALVAAGADKARALELAVLNGHERVAQDLLLAGADPDEPGSFGRVLAEACLRGHERLVRALVRQGADTSASVMGHTPLHEAARGGHANIARLLLESGLDVDAFTWQGETPLHAAARKGSASTVGVLIAAGADVGARHPTLGRGQTPLHVATQWGSTDAALALLQEHGSEVNAADNAGLRPLHLACGAVRADMVDLLLRRGADETAVDRDGRTPIDLLPTAGRIVQGDAVTASTMDDGTPDGDREQRRDHAHKGQMLDARERAARLLTRAPYDRAWRRRGVAVLCRARAETLRLRAPAAGEAATPEDCAVSTVGCRKLARQRKRGSGGARREKTARGEADVEENGVGIHGLGAWLVDLQEEGVFRNVVGFL